MMGKLTKNFFILFVVIVTIILMVGLNAQDTVIEKSFHGHDVEVKPSDEPNRIDRTRIRQSAIRGFKSAGNDNSIIVITREKGKNKQYKLSLMGCWEIDWSQTLVFDSFNSMYVQEGDSIYYAGTFDVLPRKEFGFCRITNIAEIIDEQN